MKIVYLHQYFNTPQMAGSTRSYELASRLVRMGHEVHMVTSEREVRGRLRTAWRMSVEAGIHVHWTPVPYGNEMGFARRVTAFLTFAWRAMRKAERLGGDVILATSTPLTIALPAIWAARRNRIPMVFEVRDLWPAVPIAMGIIRNPVLKQAALLLERLAYAESEHIIALAPGMKQHVVEKGVPEERVTVIPNGADIELFTGRENDAAALRASTPWLEERPLIVYCGAIGQVNGVEYLVKVAVEVAKRDDTVRFAVIGTGRSEGEVRAAARRTGLLDRTFFMLGPLGKQDVATWICAADFTVALITGPEILWKHATQNKFFDALAAGKPIANNFRGWQSEIAEAEDAGIILDAQDPARAAEELLSRLRNAEWMARASANARRLAVSRFDRNLHARQLHEVLTEARASFQVAPRRKRAPAASASARSSPDERG